MSQSVQQISKALNASKRSVSEIAELAGVANNTVLSLKKGSNLNPVLRNIESVAKVVGLKIVAVKA